MSEATVTVPLEPFHRDPAGAERNDACFCGSGVKGKRCPKLLAQRERAKLERKAAAERRAERNRKCDACGRHRWELAGAPGCAPFFHDGESVVVRGRERGLSPGTLSILAIAASGGRFGSLR